jgi:hypothetical protein
LLTSSPANRRPVAIDLMSMRSAQFAVPLSTVNQALRFIPNIGGRNPARRVDHPIRRGVVPGADLFEIRGTR